jgi:hypothetical protein
VFDRHELEGETLVLPIALIAASTAGIATSIPGGSISLPSGCSAPSKIEMGVDSFIGQVKCKGSKLSITVMGGGVEASPCASAKESGKTLAMRSRFGAPLVVCAFESRGPGADTMWVYLGPAHLSADVKTPADAILLLQIAMGFRLSK